MAQDGSKPAMELEVVSTSGLPDTGIISIRAGGTRRQAQIADVTNGKKLLKFPYAPGEVNNWNVKVDALDLLGSGRVAYNPEEEDYTMILDPVSDGQSSPMEVQFILRKEGTGPAEKTPAPDAAGASEDEKTNTDKKEGDARKYLEKHGLTSFMQFLMQSLMKDKPADPYSFLQKQVTKRMVSEVSRSILGDKVDIVDDRSVETLLAKFDGPTDVSQEELKKLEQEAAAAGDQLRADNARLRETAEQLKTKYGKLVEETSQLQTEVPASNEALPPIPAYRPEESAQVAAYREIAVMQDDVTKLARENANLVAQLASMRSSIDVVRGEIDEMNQSLGQHEAEGQHE